VQIEQLRELFLSAPEATSTRVLAAVLGVVVVVLILWLVRTRRLREEFTPLWIAGAIGLAAVSLSFDMLRLMTTLIGAWTPSATIFFLSLSFLGVVSLAYAVRLSRLVIDVKNLAQEVALLRAQIDESEAAQGAAPPPPGENR
jgi:hypothetical protein